MTAIGKSATGMTTGTGTANRIPKYTAAGAVGNSSVSDDGTTVSTAEAVSCAALTATGILTQGSAAQFLISAAGLPTKSDGIALTGQGLPLIVAKYTNTAQAGALTNVINFTPPAKAGFYKVIWSIDTTTATTDNFTVVITYANSTGNARTGRSSGGNDKAGTGLVAGAITNTIGAGNYYGEMNISVDNSATAITVSTGRDFHDSNIQHRCYPGTVCLGQRICQLKPSLPIQSLVSFSRSTQVQLPLPPADFPSSEPVGPGIPIQDTDNLVLLVYNSHPLNFQIGVSYPYLGWSYLSRQRTNLHRFRYDKVIDDYAHSIISNRLSDLRICHYYKYSIC